MGNFRIVIDAVGAHGCSRASKDGEKFSGCGRLDCPDCVTAEFIQRLKLSQSSIQSAKLIHWPEEPGTVEDEFVLDTYGPFAHRIRHGNF